MGPRAEEIRDDRGEGRQQQDECLRAYCTRQRLARTAIQSCKEEGGCESIHSNF